MDDTHQKSDEQRPEAVGQTQEDTTGVDSKSRRGFFKVAAAAAAGTVVGATVGTAEADAQEKDSWTAGKDCTPTAFGRRTKFAVVPVAAMRVNNIRSNEEVVRAQATVTPEMISALEEMVNAARAGRLTSENALGIAALAW